MVLGDTYSFIVDGTETAGEGLYSVNVVCTWEECTVPDLDCGGGTCYGDRVLCLCARQYERAL